MKTTTVYVAAGDGRQFTCPQQCKDHEERTFQAWLKANPHEFRDFLAAEHMAGNETLEAQSLAAVRRYWEWKTS